MKNIPRRMLYFVSLTLLCNLSLGVWIGSSIYREIVTGDVIIAIFFALGTMAGVGNILREAEKIKEPYTLEQETRKLLKEVARLKCDREIKERTQKKPT